MCLLRTGYSLERSAKSAGCCRAILVCPAGDRGHGYACAEDAGDVCLGGGCEVILGDCGDRSVAQDAPCEGAGGAKEEREEDGEERVHV